MRKLGIVLAAALLAFLVVGVEPADKSATIDPAAQRALDAVTTATFNPADPFASFPTNYGLVMGYLPTVVRGPSGAPILIKPTGDCSAFSGEMSYKFGFVCKEHDLAYDVLRYSAQIGRPLPAASRQQADDMFRRQLHNQCRYSDRSGLDLATCHAWAESFAVTVDFNSWRQGYRPPKLRESATQWILCVLFFLFLLKANRELERLDAPDEFDLRAQPVRR